MRDVPPPLSVTVPPPSITVSCVNVICEVTVIVIGAAPQSKTMVPPAVAATCNAAAVQLPGVPSPTVAVGAETSASAGAVQRTGGGGPASVIPPPESVPDTCPSAPASLDPPPSVALGDDEQASRKIA